MAAYNRNPHFSKPRERYFSHLTSSLRAARLGLGQRLQVEPEARDWLFLALYSAICSVWLRMAAAPLGIAFAFQVERSRKDKRQTFNMESLLFRTQEGKNFTGSLMLQTCALISLALQAASKRENQVVS